MSWVWDLLLVQFCYCYTSNFKFFLQWTTSFVYLDVARSARSFSQYSCPTLSFQKHAFLHHRQVVSSHSFSPLPWTLLLFDIWGEGHGLSQFSCSSLSFRQILCAGTTFAFTSHWRVLSPSKVQVIWLHCNFSFITHPPIYDF